jgi:predicted PurR-regulated permease PerM
MHLSFQKAFYVIATVVGLFAILILAKAVLIPIAFAFLIAFILFPVARKFESWGANEIVSAFLSILWLITDNGRRHFSFLKSNHPTLRKLN